MIDTNLPLTDIHRHLDGNIRAQTILDLGREFNLTLPAQTLETLLPHVQVTANEPDLVSFLAKLDWGVKVLASLMPAVAWLMRIWKTPRARVCITLSCVSPLATWR
jgi:adenosine deaminase